MNCLDARSPILERIFEVCAEAFLKMSLKVRRAVSSMKPDMSTLPAMTSISQGITPWKHMKSIPDVEVDKSDRSSITLI